MDIKRLNDLLERGETHRLILGNHPGPYSLGITRRAGSQEYALLLKVPDSRGFPSYVTLDGQRIKLIVEGGFKAPMALRASA